MPVPETAEENQDVEGAWTVSDADSEEVVSWYEGQLPIGESYEGLEFCETQEDGAFTSWLWWEEAPEGHDGTPWLTVRVIDEEPTGIMITYDDTDPSVCTAE